MANKWRATGFKLTYAGVNWAELWACASALLGELAVARLVRGIVGLLLEARSAVVW